MYLDTKFLYKTSLLWMIHFLILINPIFPNKTQTEREIHEKKTALNTFNDGGPLENWVVLGPFDWFGSTGPVADSLSDSLQRDSAFIKECFDYDYLLALGKESGAYIRKFSSIHYNDSTGKRVFVKAKEFTADSKGIVRVDSVFTRESKSVAYAFCMVENFLPCSIRCYWGIDGEAKVWINGNRMRNDWDVSDSCVPNSQYFDTEFSKGMNSILIKFSAINQRNRFVFSIYHLSDSLLPLQQNIHSLSFDLDNNEISDTINSFNATLRFNIPVPQNVFTGRIIVSENKEHLPPTKGILEFAGDIGTPLTIKLPDTLVGGIRLSANVTVAKHSTLEAVRYIWRGSFKKAIDDQKKRLKDLEKNPIRSEKKNRLSNFIIHGVSKWGDSWFSNFPILSIDEQIHQLTYSTKNNDLIESLFATNVISGNSSYPLLYPLPQDNKTEIIREYDPSRWLNYKYPEIYVLPEDRKGANEYRYWMFLPKKVKKRFSKIPLILSLHGVGYWGYDISRLRTFGAGAYAESVADFPFAVVTPQCRYNTLWDSKVLKMLLDSLIATGRFDTKRIYITGIGMGGFTAWHMACMYPDFIAAIVPLNAGANKEKICSMKKVAVWAFHGARNAIVPFEESQKIIMELRKCSDKDIEYSILAEHGHKMSKVVYDDPRIYKWLKKQRL